ncbi:hypothetical protein CROQUDRAFT_652351 [Cronartium quercuum f. sp. fusiforme G11]|uniref:Uncharacterized protein n=1 Tax=Cronartium quercuum f. sp. fusiforme G11 TaxID=708437 RepID=A0A9P6NR12_9BASI|nr:hypothetical protein CROQUDRAFT_652351 [Cronartium quercuum f. sp. fusiforme G11]
MNPYPLPFSIDELCEEQGIILIYFSPHSLKFNPIEKCLKAHFCQNQHLQNLMPHEIIDAIVEGVQIIFIHKLVVPMFNAARLL